MDFFESRMLKMMDIAVRKNVPLGKFTTMRVGGPADYFVEPKNEAELLSVLQSARERGLPVLLMGNGSNLLVRDGGFRGVAVRLGKGFSAITATERGLYAQSGALLSALAEESPLPRICALGSGPVAKIIRETALDEGIPIMEDKPLARALYAEGKIDDFIPDSLIEPVAEVLKTV